MAKPRGKLLLGEIALFGVLGATTFGAKVAMSWLPNIEPVSLFVMLFAVVFGLKCLYPIYLYVLLEILVYGINTWNLNYLYIWTILALVAYAMRRLKHPIWWALLSGLFGMSFGLLCAPVDFLLGDWQFVVAKWISGLGFDGIHAIGNFAIALAAFVPLRIPLTKLYDLMRRKL